MRVIRYLVNYFERENLCLAAQVPYLTGEPRARNAAKAL